MPAEISWLKVGQVHPCPACNQPKKMVAFGGPKGNFMSCYPCGTQLIKEQFKKKNTMVSKADDLSMQREEKALLANILTVLNGFKKIQTAYLEHDDTLEQYDGDNAELVHHIHILQNWVLANAAYRENPKHYRPFGCRFKQERKDASQRQVDTGATSDQLGDHEAHPSGGDEWAHSHPRVPNSIGEA